MVSATPWAVGVAAGTPPIVTTTNGAFGSTVWTGAAPGTSGDRTAQPVFSRSAPATRRLAQVRARHPSSGSRDSHTRVAPAAGRGPRGAELGDPSTGRAGLDAGVRSDAD